MAAADDPSIAGRVGAGSRASGTGALLHQLAHDERGALRILADAGADQIGAGLIARRGPDHLQRVLAPRAPFADPRERKSVVYGKTMSVRVHLGGRRLLNKKNNTYT